MYAILLEDPFDPGMNTIVQFESASLWEWLHTPEEFSTGDEGVRVIVLPGTEEEVVIHEDDYTNMKAQAITESGIVETIEFEGYYEEVIEDIKDDLGEQNIYEGSW